MVEPRIDFLKLGINENVTPSPEVETFSQIAGWLTSCPNGPMYGAALAVAPLALFSMRQTRRGSFESTVRSRCAWKTARRREPRLWPFCSVLPRSAWP